jgi:predicted membrane channel-forming protein YqfA (hemolysin III family)
MTPPTTPPTRLRILFGTLGLIVGLGLYALLVMRLAVAVLPDNRWIEAVFYLAFGMVWIFPAARLTRWMQDLPPVPDRFGN